MTSSKSPMVGGYEYLLYAICTVAGVALHVFFSNLGEHHFYGWRHLQAFLALESFPMGGDVDLVVAVRSVPDVSNDSQPND
jgi:hypothetical protein